MHRFSVPRTLAGLATAAAVCTVCVPSALAAPVAVDGGVTNWQTARNYTPSSARTYFGYVLNSGNPMFGASNGTVTASAGAELIKPDGATRVASVTHTDTPAPAADSFWTMEFDITGGTVDVETGEADLTSTGTINFNGHGGALDMTLTNPRIKLAADGTGGVYMGGSVAPATTVDPAEPIFTLDATKASFAQLGGGKIAISNLIPTMGGTTYFGGSYAAGVAGPDRTPNTFGGFSVLAEAQAGNVAPAQGKPVIETHTITNEVEKIVERVVEVATPVTKYVDRPVAVDRPVTVERTIELAPVRALLTKRPFGKGTVNVELTTPGSDATALTGYVTSKRLTVFAPRGTKLSGSYTLTRTSGSKRHKKTAKVTVASKAPRK